MILHFNHGEEMQKFFFGDTSNNVKIYDSIIKAISIGIHAKIDHVRVWEITFANGDDDMIIDCDRTEWNENLQNALNWYTENEMFEQCAIVKNLLDKL